MVDWKAYARRIEEDLAECRKHLAPLESGTMRIGTREYGGQWEDTTPAMIATHKRTIATYEAILKDVRSRTQDQS
jgi:hypothetical protein